MDTCKITILETSDVHGNIFPIQYSSNEYTHLGFSKIASLIKEIKKNEKNVLLIDNGDLIQGTPLMYYHAKYEYNKPNPMIKVLNHLKYDAAIIGNHEFNYGLPFLEKSVNESNFPWLSANILYEKTKYPYFGAPYLIKTLPNNVKIAVLGLTTSYIPNWEHPEHIKHLHFEDVVQSAKNWVKYIHENEKPDVLVVSYHGGFERDLLTGEQTEKDTGENVGYRICTEIQGIDCLLTGHQHRQIANASINGCVVVQPGFNGHAIGKITLSLERIHDKWTIVHKSSEILSVENVHEDKEVIDLCQQYEKKTQIWLDKPIGKIDGDMTVRNPFDVRKKDHPLIEFINKVQMDAAGVDISNTALFHNESKGFREDVTMRDIVSNYIYPNTLVVLTLLGKDIKSALEQSASYFMINDENELDINPKFSKPKPQHYNYDMWEGIEYIIDVRKPIGERIVHLTYKNEAIEDNKEYKVVMNNYRAGGGGEYAMFKNKKIIKEIQTDMAELLANYFLKHKKIKATCNENWKIIY